VRFDGVIKTWNDERGFGFITPTRGDHEINRDGKKRARDAGFAQAASSGANIERRLRARQRMATLLVLPAFCALFLGVAVIWRVPAWLGLVYLVTSVMCFALYAVDKSAAVMDGGGFPSRISSSSDCWAAGRVRSLPSNCCGTSRAKPPSGPRFGLASR
jgi:hypothetical protein